MSRLIDADALIELIESGTDLKFDEVTEKAVIRMINEQDTKFDVEDVVTNIEQLKVETNKNNYRASFALDVAIAMVKGEIQ